MPAFPEATKPARQRNREIAERRIATVIVIPATCLNVSAHEFRRFVEQTHATRLHTGTL